METSIRSFVPLDKLGEGSFASVYKVQRVCDHQIYALKKIRMGHLPPKAKENALNQVRLLASLRSPYITKYYEAFFDQDIECLCIVMELADQGDLRKTINTAKQHKKLITQLQIWKVLIHLLHGLKILHDNAILHRDLKCENILVSGGYYKIGDMNVSKINKDGLVCTQTGTPYYASPEVWQDRPYNQKSDMWSLGCIIYEMAALRPPFTGSSMNDLHKNIMRGNFHPIPKIYSNELAQIIHQCLKLSPNQRPSVSDLLSNWSLKMYENICIEYKIDSMETNVNMLKTIALPKNIKDLNKCLPKSNYESELSERKSQVLSRQSYSTEKVKSQRSSVLKPKEIKLIEEKQNYREKTATPQQVSSLRGVATRQNFQMVKQDEKGENCEIIQKDEPEKEILREIEQKSVEENKQPQKSQQKSSQPTDAYRQISSESDLPKINEVGLKKMCSLNEIQDSEQKISTSQRKASSAKSIEEIESFNRLIQRIKSSAKTASTKIQKIERKKSRRMLIDVNSNKLPENKQRSKSKSIRRTERSISKESISQQMVKEKPHPNLNQGQYGRHERKEKADSENRLLSKYMLNGPISSKYTKVLEEAKGYLRRSSSRKNKIF